MNVSSATTMYRMFVACASLESVKDVESWDVSSLETAEDMFRQSGIKAINLSKWEPVSLSGGNAMFATFAQCPNLQTVNLDGWEVPNIIDLYNTFASSTALTEVTMKNWKAAGLTRLWFSFSNCTSLESLDMSGWDAPNLYYMDQTFSGCSKLKN